MLIISIVLAVHGVHIPDRSYIMNKVACTCIGITLTIITYDSYQVTMSIDVTMIKIWDAVKLKSYDSMSTICNDL